MYRLFIALSISDLWRFTFSFKHLNCIHLSIANFSKWLSKLGIWDSLCTHWFCFFFHSAHWNMGR